MQVVYGCVCRPAVYPGEAVHVRDLSGYESDITLWLGCYLQCSSFTTKPLRISVYHV